MKILLILFCFIFLEISSSSSSTRFKRQFWPEPPNPFLNGDHPMRGGFDEDNRLPDAPWMRQMGRGDDRPSINNIDDDLFSSNGFGGNSFNENNFNRNDFNGDDFNGNSQIDERRRTTQAPGTNTPTPRTIHSSPEGCSCSSTPQFNPVCGSDGNTYKNSGLLNCYRQCGTNVSQKRMGTC